MNQTVLHGEMRLTKINKLPEGLKKVSFKGKDFKIADSETSGNHHLVELVSGTKIFEDRNGTIYIKNNSPTKVKCVMQERHGSIDMDSGVWEIRPGKEFNYETMEEENIAD